MIVQNNFDNISDNLQQDFCWVNKYGYEVLFYPNKKYIAFISNSKLELYNIVKNSFVFFENFKMLYNNYILTEKPFYSYKIWNIKTNTYYDIKNEGYRSIILDGDIFFAVKDDDTTDIWNIHTGYKLATIDGTYRKTNCHKYILTESESHKIYLWERSSFRLTKSFDNSIQCLDIQIPSNCKPMIVQNFNENTFTYNTWSIKTEQFKKQLLRVSKSGMFKVRYKSDIYSISPNSKYMIVQKDDEYVTEYKVIHTKSGKNILSFSRSSKHKSQILFTPDSQYIVYSTFYRIKDETLDGYIRYKIVIQNLDNFEHKVLFDNLQEFVLLNNGKILLGLTPEGIIKIIDIERGEVVKVIGTLEGKVEKIKSTPNQNYIILFDVINIVLFNIETYAYSYIVQEPLDIYDIEPNQDGIYDIKTTEDFDQILVVRAPDSYSRFAFELFSFDLVERKYYGKEVIPPSYKKTKPVKLKTIKDFGYKTDELIEGDEWIYTLWEWAHKNNISGNDLPKNKRDLQLLTELNFWYSGISNLPSELFNLKNLTEFGVFRNLELKKIPKEIKKLSNLKKLSFMNCSLTTIPTEITYLNKVEHLKLESNKINKLPREIGQMLNLKILELRDNNLHELPKEILNLKKLEFLSIDTNPNLKLTKEQAEWIKTLKN